NFKNHTFHSLCEVERHLMAELNKLSLNFETVKNITRFKWIKNTRSAFRVKVKEEVVQYQ
ncbi:hypothetical protein EZS27_030135, partial [termite gut metagenome]